MRSQIKNSGFFGAGAKEDRSVINGETVYYRLYRIQSCYVIKITMGKEKSVCCFGKNKKAAEEIFAEIVKSRVTPCTLCDIAEDFVKSGKKM